MMREVLSHRAGKIFFGFLALCVVGFLAAAWTFDRGIVVLGWMPLPFALGIGFVAVALCAVVLYLFRYWPYR
ncbi:MAG: hypothetical protein ACYTHM_25765 [Planctomycetota bacterium]